MFHIYLRLVSFNYFTISGKMDGDSKLTIFICVYLDSFTRSLDGFDTFGIIWLVLIKSLDIL